MITGLIPLSPPGGGAPALFILAHCHDLQEPLNRIQPSLTTHGPFSPVAAGKAQV